MSDSYKLIFYIMGPLSFHQLDILSTNIEEDPMEKHALKNVNNCLNTNIYSYLETSGGQISNLYLNAVHFFNTGVN